MKRVFLLLLAIMFTMTEAHAKSLSPVEFMLGCWGDDNNVELWKKTPEGLQGEAKTYRNQNLVFWEHLEIRAMDDKIIYTPFPQGVRSVDFRYISQSKGDHASFINQQHDFPQRISYTLTEDGLKIDLEGVTDDLKPKHISYVLKKRQCPPEDQKMTKPKIELEILLPISKEQAWAYWTDNLLLTKWLSVVAKVEPRRDGAYELFWSPETPELNSTLGCKITHYQPYEDLHFEWRGPVPFAEVMNTTPLPTYVQLSFEELEAKKTKIKLTHLGWGEGELWEKAYKWQQQAWEMAFNELQALQE